MLTRREFSQRAGFFVLLASLGSGVISQIGCDFGSVFSKIKDWIKLGIGSFQSIVDLLAASGVIPMGAGTVIDMAITLVKAAFTDLTNAVTQYENAPADQKSTFAGKLSTMLAVLESTIGTFWADLKIPDTNLSKLIEGLVNIVISTIAGFSTQLPAPAPAAAAKLSAARAVHAVAPVKRSISQFKRDFNALLAQSGHSKYALR
jgi:hypothetical protein